MIDAIAGISSLTDTLKAASTSPTNQPNGAAFLATLDREFAKVNTDVAKAESNLQKLASGEPVELHSVMISLEQARIGVQTVIQIRNRMVEAYQDLTRMQI
ncbi:MAG: flagellar hook-basal body complex protein FliE [Aquabacterium sp.]|uniref:flagellar hook-basal body complex protein FliE n=1 Tax=Aquabacterium sp. TaxID=1872578 RepID=UPI00272158DA|nr:flagellar hook-basal body complex protein FliE [Aquabacterium sp.]MDO9005740.1 flagellar hook-basal body complex protein FliE [Aquabacterium sp.]